LNLNKEDFVDKIIEFKNERWLRINVYFFNILKTPNLN
jgi:hypothetical protein